MSTWVSWRSPPGTEASVFAACRWAMGKKRRIRLGVGVHQKVGEPGRDRRWRSRSGCWSPASRSDSGRFLSRKIVASGAVSLPARDAGRRARDREKTELTDDQGLATLPPSDSHLASSGVVARQGARGREQADIARLG